MTDEADDDQELESAEDIMHGPDGALDCVAGRYDLIAYWLAKLGIDDPSGSAMTFGENCSLAILHPDTGEWLTPAQIVKMARAGAKPTRIQ